MKDVNVQSQFFDEIQRTLAEKNVEGVEEVWRGFKNGLLETADKVCGRTKQKEDRSTERPGGGMTKL